MSQAHGNFKAAMSYPIGWPRPFSSPNAMLAGTKLADLAWAFQVHGWSCCIPYATSVVQKIGALRLKLVAQRNMRALAPAGEAAAI